jgi:hypothetical protein
MSVFAAQHLRSRIPLIAAIGRLPRRGNVAQERRDPSDCGQVFDPFRGIRAGLGSAAHRPGRLAGWRLAPRRSGQVARWWLIARLGISA